MPITFDTPEDPDERRLTLAELREALVGPKFRRRPDIKTIYRWMALPEPMPFKSVPNSGKTRITRRFLLSHVLAWLDDPQAYYGRKTRRTA